MYLKVIVSWLLFTLNSAEFYIYCLRINRFKAWPISAPAYFSPCETQKHCFKENSVNIQPMKRNYTFVYLKQFFLDFFLSVALI